MQDTIPTPSFPPALPADVQDTVVAAMAAGLTACAQRKSEMQFSRLHIAPIAPVRPNLQSLLARTATQARPFTRKRKPGVLQSIISSNPHA